MWGTRTARSTENLLRMPDRPDGYKPVGTPTRTCLFATAMASQAITNPTGRLYSILPLRALGVSVRKFRGHSLASDVIWPPLSSKQRPSRTRLLLLWADRVPGFRLRWNPGHPTGETEWLNRVGPRLIRTNSSWTNAGTIPAAWRRRPSTVFASPSPLDYCRRSHWRG